MTEFQTSAGEPPTPSIQKLRFQLVLIFMIVMPLSLVALFWALGSGLLPMLVIGSVHLAAGLYLVRTVTEAARHECKMPQPTPAVVEAVRLVNAPPLGVRHIGLFVTVCLATGGTAFIVKQSAVPDSPELVAAREVCQTAWEDFELTGSAPSQESWTGCLLANPSLASSCDLSGKLAAAMLGAETVGDVTLSSEDLMVCGRDIY